MKVLHRFVLSAFVAPLIATFFVVMFVLVLQFLWLYIDDMVGKGLEIMVVVELISYAAINLITMALPLTVLLASIMVMGNLGEHNELLALKASGISLWRIAFPVFVVVTMLSVGSFVVANNVLPYTNLKFTSLLFSVKQQRPELQIQPGIFYDGIQDYIVKADDKNDETGMLLNLMIYNHGDPNGARSLTVADSGYLRITSDQKYLIFTLYGGNVYDELKESGSEPKYPLNIRTFKEQESVFELTGYGFERSDENLFKNRAQMLNLQQLSTYADSLRTTRNQLVVQNFNNYFHSSYFTHSQEIGKPDSIAMLQYKYPLTLDSLMKTMTAEQIGRAASRAVQRAREAKSEIVTQVEQLRGDNRQINSHDIQWHLMFVYPLGCLIFFFVGAPIGAIIRKGGFGTSFVISLVAFLLYYVISIIFQKYARDGILSSASAMWVSSVVTASIGILFTYKAIKDRTFTLPKWYLWVAQKVRQWLHLKK
jgi:lipopolysaccharide export system permease protein